MEGQTIPLASHTLAYSVSPAVTSTIATLVTLIPCLTNTTSLELCSIPHNSDNRGFDSNGVPSTVIGSIGLCIAAATLISGWKVWKIFSRGKASAKDKEPKLDYPESSHPVPTSTLNSTDTTNHSILNIHLSPSIVETSDLAFLSFLKALEEGGSREASSYGNPVELEGLALPERSLRWPPHERPG